MKKDRTRDVIIGALNAQVISHLALTVGTMYGVNKAVFDAIVANGTDIETAAIAAVCAAVPAGIAVDGSLKKWLPYVIAWITGKKDRDTGVERKGWLNVVILLLCVAQLSVSTFLNFSVSPEIVDDAAGTANTEKYDRMAERANGRYEKDLGRISEGINQAKKTLAVAEKNKADLVAAAKKSKGAEMARLAEGGNGWAKNEIAAAVRRAERKGDRSIKTATKALEKERSRESAYMDKSGGTLDSVTVAATALTVNTENKLEEKKSRWTNVMMIFMGLMAFTFILSTVVVVVLEEETGQDFDQLPTASNIVGGIFNKTKRGFTKGVISVFGLEKFTNAPNLAVAGQDYAAIATQSHAAQNTGTQKDNTVPTQERAKKACSVSGFKDSKTQERTEPTDTDTNTGPVLHARNQEGVEWPTPENKKEWGKLVRKAREWAKESIGDSTPETKERNAKKWAVFCEYAKNHGHRAGTSDEGKPYVINQAAEPVWSEGDTRVVWSVDANDSDTEYTQD